MIDFTKLSPALATLTRREATIEGDTLSSSYTHSRRLELSNESDGTVSAWTIADTIISGKVVLTALLIGALHDESRLPRVLLRAKASIGEVVQNGSRAATLLSTLRDSSGRQVFAYAASELDATFAAVQFASFCERHGLIDDTAEKPVKAAKLTKKPPTVGVPA